MTERNGVLVIRVWMEAGAPPVRARLLDASGVDPGGPVTIVAVAGVDEICAGVRDWVEQFAGTRGGGDGAVTAR